MTEKEIMNAPKAIRLVLRYPWQRKRRARLLPWRRRQLRRYLNRLGYVTPNFRWSETVSRDGKHVPKSLRKKAIRHAWNLERFRHAVGDKPLSFLSWYRSPEHNREVEGASQSKHMEALATDLTTQTINRIGRWQVMAAANEVFATGGVGDYPSGAVHVDSRGWRARWTSY